MPSTTESTSKITLKMYVELLKRASHGSLGYIHDLPSAENRVARELLKSGLISNDKVEFSFGGPGIVSEASLTPEGAFALESWDKYLKEQSQFYKFGEALIRFLWVIVGALAASITEIFKMFST